jgi:hypothetical protein
MGAREFDAASSPAIVHAAQPARVCSGIIRSCANRDRPMIRGGDDAMRRRRSSRAKAARLLAIAALSSVLLHCSGRREHSIGGAIAFLADPAHIYEHAAFYFLNFMHRRFDIESFAGVSNRYWELVPNAPKPFTGVDAFERLIDPNARRPDQLAPAMNEIDKFTVAALYCDQIPVGESYEARMAQLATEGGYALTHVALAIKWLEENGCDPPSPALRTRVIKAMAAGVVPDDRLEDTEIERAAFLYYLDRGDLVPRGFIASLLRAQNRDGGWPEFWPDTQGGGSHWHPTVLALWVLLESDGRSNGARMIPPRTS